jgi:nucleoside-diphosphate-sugar epimerase
MSLNPQASSAKAKAVLGWQPRFPDYKQGIEDALLSWRAAAEVS